MWCQSLTWVYHKLTLDSGEARKLHLSQRMRFLSAEKVMFAGPWRLTQRRDQTQHKTQILLHKIIHILPGSESSRQKQIAVKASRDLKTSTDRCTGVFCSSSWIYETFKDWNVSYAASLSKPDTATPGWTTTWLQTGSKMCNSHRNRNESWEQQKH